jgi:hypothetical protein
MIEIDSRMMIGSRKKISMIGPGPVKLGFRSLKIGLLKLRGSLQLMSV